MDNPAFIGVGAGLGVGMGLAIGKGLEEKYKKQGQIRSLTEEEQQRKKRERVVGLSVLAIGMLAFAVVFLLR